MKRYTTPFICCYSFVSDGVVQRRGRMAYVGMYAYLGKITPFLPTHPKIKNGLKVACYFTKNPLKKGHPPLKLTIIIMIQQNFRDKKWHISLWFRFIFEDQKVALLLWKNTLKNTPTPELFLFFATLIFEKVRGQSCIEFGRKVENNQRIRKLTPKKGKSRQKIMILWAFSAYTT